MTKPEKFYRVPYDDVSALEVRDMFLPPADTPGTI